MFMSNLIWSSQPLWNGQLCLPHYFREILSPPKMSLWISSSIYLTNPSSETSWKAIWIALVIFYIPICICKASSIHPSSYHRRKCRTMHSKKSCCQLVKHTIFYSSWPPVYGYIHFFLFFFFGLAPWHVGMLFPNQGLNPHKLHWKRGVLTTGPPGKSHTFCIFFFFYTYIV